MSPSHASRNGVTFTLTNAPWHGTTVPGRVDHVETPDADRVPGRSAGVRPTVTVDGVTDFANHGEYVTAMGGGKIAAQKCAGMPLVSKQGK